MGKNREKPMNLVRILAEDLLPSVMQKMGVPDTEENREDILALTLNSLPTKYVNTDGGRLYAQLVDVYRLQYESDVIIGLTRASKKVLEKPRHKPEGTGDKK
ncbi:MAG: late competence development ComFB family protein [Clostridiales Family XIII bacterium]|jgi:competence protein ComFB|nr:late competence development ComFB family protein [Clostridiales Family XIII bacterium]